MAEYYMAMDDLDSRDLWTSERSVSHNAVMSDDNDDDEFVLADETIGNTDEKAVVVYKRENLEEQNAIEGDSSNHVVQYSDADIKGPQAASPICPVNLVNCKNVNITYGSPTSDGSQQDVLPTHEEFSQSVDDGGSPVDLDREEHRFLRQAVIKKYRHKAPLPEGPPISIVLVGKTGNGKSATANTIFWEDGLFESDIGFESQTKSCHLETGIVGGRKISIVDSPGNMDPNHKRRILHEIGSAIFLSPDGYDAIILVLTLSSRMTGEEKEAVKQLKNLFQDVQLLANYGILLFTNGDRYRKSIPFNDYIRQTGDEFVKDLMEECQNRVVLFDNSVNVMSDEKKSYEQVEILIKEIDKLVKRNGGKKYTNSFFDKAKDLHCYIEKTDWEQRSVYEREKAEFEEIQLKREEEERRKEQKEMEERQSQMKLQQDLYRERYNRELQDTIQQEREVNIKPKMHSNIKLTSEKWQKDWNFEVEKIYESYQEEMGAVVTRDREEQAVKLDDLLKLELQSIQVELDEIFPKGSHQEESYVQRKEQFQSHLENEIQGKMKLANIQWMKTCKEVLNSQSRLLQRQIGSKNTEQEDQWMNTLRLKLGEYEDSFNQETTSVIMKAESEFSDLVAEKVMMDLTWKHSMERLKDQHKLKWSAKLRTQTLWKDDLLRTRKEWEEECKNLFRRMWQRMNRDMTEQLYVERQRQETLWTVDFRQKGRDKLNDLREEFKEVEKTRNIDQLKKSIHTEDFREERAWQQIIDSNMENLCSEQDNNWKGKAMGSFTRLNENDVNTGLAETIRSDALEQRQTSIEHWKRVVKTSVDETCRQSEQKLTQSSREIERELSKESTDIYAEGANNWVVKTENLRKSWKKDTKEAIQRKLKNDKEKLDKVMDGWKSFEKDWKNVVANRRTSFESSWKNIYSELSKTDGLVSEDIEISTIRDVLERKLELSRINHEKCWLFEEDRLCQSHLQTLQDKMGVVIEARNVSNEKSLRKEIQRQNNTWGSEAKDFLLQKEIYWKTYVDGERGELDAKNTKIIERNMEEHGNKWREMALKECNRLVNRWRQHLRKKREEEEKKWITELQKLRENREWEWEVDLRAMRPRWKKDDMEVIEHERKSLNTDLRKKFQEKRKKLETEWEGRNQQQMDEIVSNAMTDIIKKGIARKEDKLKTIKERRQTEEKKWELNLKKKRLDHQKSKLDEVCTQQFDKTFEELNKCFPVTSKVIIKPGKKIPMDRLQKGQEVLCTNQNGKLIYSQVFRFGHKTNEGKHIFVKITTATQELKLSSNHHVIILPQRCCEGFPAKVTVTKAAADVQIGDNVLVYDKDTEKLHAENVEDVMLVMESGLYAPYTLSGNIIVDGILASCYVNRIKPQLAHRLLAPARLIYRFSGVTRKILRTQKDKAMKKENQMESLD